MKKRTVKTPVFSRKTLKILLGINALCFASSWALAIFFFYYKEYVMGGAMLFIMFLTGKNMLNFYKQLKALGGQDQAGKAS